MVQTIAIANQKGGVGKTTTSVNLAASLAEINRRVLLVDMDPQGNSTMGCGVDKAQLELSSYEVLLDECEINEAVVRPDHLRFEVLPTNIDLTAVEVHLLQMQQRESRLKMALQKISDRYDYIIIDCPPSLSMLTVNSLVAASSVLVPMQCEYFALEGLSALMDTLRQIRESVNKNLRLEGLLRTMYDSRSRLTRDVDAQLVTHFEDRIFKTIVPRNVRLAEAPSFGVPILQYDKNSRGAKAYMELARELDEKYK